ncbi:MAG: NUDIX hydrolase [Anaerolineae bacterium]|nr:NUDIX hydrolase [Anaerolineae bacterium]
MEESITATRQIFKGRVVDLKVHEVQMPDGEKSRRELVHHPGAVAIVAMDEEKNVILVRQFRIGAGKPLYEIPAGILEKGEPPENCAIRELQEEAGYKQGHLELLSGFYTAPGYTTEFIHVYLATQLTASRLAGDKDEFVQSESLPLVRALKMIEDRQIEDSKTIIGLLQTARRLGL